MSSSLARCISSLVYACRVSYKGADVKGKLYSDYGGGSSKSCLDVAVSAVDNSLSFGYGGVTAYKLKDDVLVWYDPVTCREVIDKNCFEMFFNSDTDSRSYWLNVEDRFALFVKKYDDGYYKLSLNNKLVPLGTFYHKGCLESFVEGVAKYSGGSVDFKEGVCELCNKVEYRLAHTVELLGAPDRDGFVKLVGGFKFSKDEALGVGYERYVYLMGKSMVGDSCASVWEDGLSYRVDRLLYKKTKGYAKKLDLSDDEIGFIASLCISRLSLYFDKAYDFSLSRFLQWCFYTLSVSGKVPSESDVFKYYAVRVIGKFKNEE